MPTVDRDFIIAHAKCPVCNAWPGRACQHAGKRSLKKTLNRVSHFERMQAAQRIAREMESDEEALIEP